MPASNSEKRYQELAEKWLNNTITSEEKREFDQFYQFGQDNDVNLPAGFASTEQELEDRIYSSIDFVISDNNNSRSWYQSWYASAAVLVAVIATTLYFYSARPHKDQIVSKPQQSKTKRLNSLDPNPAKLKTKHLSQQLSENNLTGNNSRVKGIAYTEADDIKPANDKTVLILANGSKIILDDARNGILLSSNGVCIAKTADGELVYTYSKQRSDTSGDANEVAGLNIIQTPKGGRFLVTLVDGSKVWLNAASSLRFPTNFTNDKRKVELSGEAYFEVAHDEKRIFEVTTNNQAVEVLGTHFNINAYADEPSVNTTLLQGSVRIFDLRSNNSQLLKPGEQSKLGEKMEIAAIENADLAVAWKNGYFMFDGVDIKTVMRQIERWYDVSVRYEGSLAMTHRFGGEIERNLSLLQVLKVLEKTKVHFRLEGREVIVMM